MGETYQEGTGAGADFDLTQFYQIFFEEAGENLDQMERILLDLDLTAANDEELNGIFRCAHSIKGGSATFGFSDVAELNMFVARSAQPMISLLLSFVRRYLIVKENRITDRF